MPQRDWNKQLELQGVSAQLANPKAAAKLNKIRPFNFLEKAMFGNDYAITWPNNTVAVNANLADLDKVMPEVLSHEMVHVGQPNRNPIQKIRDFFTPWEKIPAEQEAMKAEWNIPWKPKGRDTYLPSSKDYMSRVKK